MNYAGIGSRETPLPVIAQMKMIGAMLGVRGFTLRSGCAKPPINKRTPGTDSADLAFEAGARSVSGPMVLRVATLWKPAMDHAAQFHPNWEACNEHARALHARNSLIMLGDTLNDPVSFVVCWTPGGGMVGGTGQALRIAAAYGVPVFNLAVTPVDAFWSWLASAGR